MIDAEVMNMTLGQRISELRKERGYAQEYVAEQLNVSRQAVSKWETDQCAPDTYNLIALSELFGVSVEYLATGKGGEMPQTPTGMSPLSMRQIAGLVLMTVCLLSSMLALVLQTPVLFAFSALLVIGAIALLVNAKHAALIALWAQWVLVTVVIIVATGTPLAVFSFYWVYWVYWAWFVVNVVWTVRVLWKRKK